MLLEQREFLALNAYVALCYARLDYYDVSQEILQVRAPGHKPSIWGEGSVYLPANWKALIRHNIATASVVCDGIH